MNGKLIEVILEEASFEKGISSSNFNTKKTMKGMYYFVLKTGTDVQTKKVIIMGQ